MTVEEMLSRISSAEIAQWQAYEKAFGPIGHQYSDDLLASIHEQLQVIAKLSGAALVSDSNDNPVPNPRHTPRPPELFRPPEDEDDSDVSIYDEID